MPKHHNPFSAANPVHYLIADASGHSVIVEFIDNEIKVIDTPLPWQVCTNFIVYGSDVPDQAPCRRYKKAFQQLKQCDGNTNDTAAMNILSATAQGYPYPTMWSAVYDLKKLKVVVALDKKFTDQYCFSLSN